MSQPRSFMLVTPTASEYAPVKSAVAGWLGGGRVQLEMCGIGVDRAEAFARRLDRSGPWGGLALTGWAGGVHPDLAAGDVVVAEVALDDDGRRAPCTAIDLAGARRGPLVTVRAPLLAPEDKRAARHSGALAVEMEAYPLAAWAASRNVPFLHARIILDGVDDSLPNVDHALDPFGRVKPGRLARLLLARPHLAVELWSMGRRLQPLRPTLGALAREILEAWLR
jgi:nucleoside phosphorylase